MANKDITIPEYAALNFQELAYEYVTQEARNAYPLSEKALPVLWDAATSDNPLSSLLLELEFSGLVTGEDRDNAREALLYAIDFLMQLVEQIKQFMLEAVDRFITSGRFVGQIRK